MSAKECAQLTAKGSQNYVNAGGVFIVSDQLFDSTSSASSSNGTISTSDTLDTFSTTRSNDPQGSPSYSSPLAILHSADSCPLQPPSKHHKPSCSPPPPFKYSRKVEHNNGAVRRSMGLMKLRRQGSHPPATTTSCHGSFNQAAAARELMASLERLSLKEKPMDVNAERERVELQRALLAGEGEPESIYAAASRRNGLKLAELPLTAKIAAAMDAEGLIGVQEEITLQCEKYKSRAALHSMSDQCSPPPSAFKAKLMRSCKSHPGAGGVAASNDDEVRSITLPKRHCKRRHRWIILRRLRSSRALLGKLWIKLKRVFSSSPRKHLQNQVLKVNN